MADNHSKEVRSINMSHIRSTNSKPEEIVRKYLFAEGFRYRKNVKKLPGCPDIVLPKYKAVIFVNGCFWHKHDCPRFVWPSSNQDYWRPKILRNVERDNQSRKELETLGWKVITVWECELKKNVLNETLGKLIAELKDSKTVLVSYHANDPNAGMATNKDLSKFKLFLCDTGLFTTLMFKDKDFTENIIYEKLLNDKLGTNLGYLYENVVAQLLHSNGNELFYHTFMNKTSHHNYEVDFLLAQKNKVCPIEVKSSGYKTHKSLDAFSLKYSDRILQKYLVYTKDFCKDRT